MTTVAIVQARMSSTRLPRKTLEDVAGRPLLEYVTTRLGRARSVDTVVVATSDDPSDDVIAEFCRARGVRCHRGSLDDVLDRVYRAADAADAGVVVRITADCPFVDPEIVDRVVEAYFRERCDYASNVHPPTFPDGFDVEVLGRGVLETVWREALRPSDRMHVTSYLTRGAGTGRFLRYNLACEVDQSGLRVTVDSPADLEVVRKIAEHFGHDRFSCRDVVRYLEEHPEVRALNAMHGRNEGYAADRAKKGEDDD